MSGRNETLREAMFNLEKERRNCFDMSTLPDSSEVAGLSQRRNRRPESRSRLTAMAIEAPVRADKAEAASNIIPERLDDYE